MSRNGIRVPVLLGAALLGLAAGRLLPAKGAIDVVEEPPRGQSQVVFSLRVEKDNFSLALILDSH